MNKVGLSLSILSLCCFISTEGWAGEFYYNNPLSKKDNPPPQPTVVSVSCVQAITTTSNGQVTTTQGSCPNPPSVVPQGSSCVQTTTTTYSDGKVTTTGAPCPTPDSNNH